MWQFSKPLNTRLSTKTIESPSRSFSPQPVDWNTNVKLKCRTSPVDPKDVGVRLDVPSPLLKTFTRTRESTQDSKAISRRRKLNSNHQLGIHLAPYPDRNLAKQKKNMNSFRESTKRARRAKTRRERYLNLPKTLRFSRRNEKRKSLEEARRKTNWFSTISPSFCLRPWPNRALKKNMRPRRRTKNSRNTW